MTIFGYARVSTDGQSLSAQIAQLKAAECDKIFREKISGARADRNQLKRLLKIVERDDLVIVTRLDRLARSTRDLLNILGTLAESGVGFRSLSDTWADTTTAHGRLMLTVLGGLAEFERELIRVRTGEGRARAKARGVQLNRSRSSLTSKAGGACSSRRRRGIGGHRASFNVSHSTISRLR